MMLRERGRERLAQMEGTLQAKLPQRSPMEISGELFSRLLEYYLLLPTCYIISHPNRVAYGNKLYVFSHSYSRHHLVHVSWYLLPPRISGQKGLFFFWKFTEAKENEPNGTCAFTTFNRIASLLTLSWPLQGTRPIPKWSRKLWPTSGGQGREWPFAEIF